jgi:hypothetical protein
VPDSDFTAVTPEPDLESGSGSKLTKMVPKKLLKKLKNLFDEFSGGVKSLNVSFKGL